MATDTERQLPRMTGQSASMIAWAVSMHWLYMRGSTYSIARQVIIALRDMIPSIVHELDAQVAPHPAVPLPSSFELIFHFLPDTALRQFWVCRGPLAWCENLEI